jgi:manganese transport protein
MEEKSLSEVHESVDTTKGVGRWRKLLAFIGPAYLVSVGYMDPGNWATDIAGGSQFGYSLIWVLLLSNWIALLLQSLSSKLGIVKGWDLAQASRQHYPSWINYSLYGLAEIAIAATDLAEIIGMAIGLNLLFDLPLLYGVIISVLDTFLLLLLLNRGIRKIELFIVSLVSIIALSFFAELLIVKPDLKQVASGFIPSALEGDALYIAIGIIGATVMPHNLYLHSSLVQTRRIKKNKEGIKGALKYNFIDSAIALNAAFFVNAGILILAATAFYNRGLYEVADIGDAHELLQGIFGNLAPTLFAIALIAAGQSSTITGTLAGQIVMEGYLNLRISPWIRRMLTRLIAVLPAVITLWYFGDDKLGDLLIFSQVVLSLQLGFAIIPLIHFTNSPELMGEFKNKAWVKVLAWTSAFVIIGLNIKLVIEELHRFHASRFGSNQLLNILIVLVLIYVAMLLLYILFHPWFKKVRSRNIIPHLPTEVLDLRPAKKFRKIAIAVDFSDLDKLSIQQAIGMGDTDCEFLLIHIIESATAVKYGDEVMDEETQFDQAVIGNYAEQMKQAGFPAQYVLGYGSRAESISKIVVENGGELLVMGAHGHKVLKDVLLGSTIDAVRHKLNIPILVVK